MQFLCFNCLLWYWQQPQQVGTVLFFWDTFYTGSVPQYYASDTVICYSVLKKKISLDPAQTILSLNKVNIQSYSWQIQGHFSHKSIRKKMVIQKIIFGFMWTIMSILHFCVRCESILFMSPDTGRNSSSFWVNLELLF